MEQYLEDLPKKTIRRIHERITIQNLDGIPSEIFKECFNRNHRRIYKENPGEVSEGIHKKLPKIILIKSSGKIIEEMSEEVLKYFLKNPLKIF